MRPRGPLLVGVVSLAIAVVLFSMSCGPPAERAAGVARAPGGGVEIRYALCGGQRVHFVRLLDYGESYGNAQTGPVLWQIHSAHGAPLPRVAVGKVPAGFHEDANRLPLPGPSGLTVVTDAHGDDIMSFRLSELRRNRVYRADYVYVSQRAFARQGRRDCGPRLRAHRFAVGGFAFLALAAVTLGAAIALRIAGEFRAARRLRP